MKRFEDRNVMITGAGGGIGCAVMREFAAEGANIIACEYKELEIFKEKWDTIANDYGCTIYPIFFDLSDDEAIKIGMKNVAALKIPIDVLVNCAGIAKFAPIMMTSTKIIKDIFQVNFFAQVSITQNVSKIMLRAKKGAIVNLASIAGIESTPGNCSYGTSKAALISFTKVASQELYPYGIRINAVAPGIIDTPMQRNADKKITDAEINKQAIKRMGDPSEVAKTILFLASDDSSYITGQILRVDGGM